MDLTVCNHCGADFVCPADWHSREDGRIWLKLRCGACEAVSETVVSSALADRYDSDLRRGMATIEETIAELEREDLLARGMRRY